MPGGRIVRIGRLCRFGRYPCWRACEEGRLRHQAAPVIRGPFFVTFVYFVRRNEERPKDHHGFRKNGCVTKHVTYGQSLFFGAGGGT